MNAYHHRKRIPLSCALAFFCISLCAVKAQSETGLGGTGVDGKATSGSEVRNHNSAFSLLLEAYRQFQNNLIQSDYQNRASAAASLPDIATRKKIMALVGQERDLRIQKLAAQVDSFAMAYEYSDRRVDQKVSDPSRPGVDLKAAADKLRDFVVIAPAADGSQGGDDLRILPASAVLTTNCYRP